MLRSLIACVFLAGVSLAQSQVRAEGDPEVGQDLAADWCSRCHDIWAGGTDEAGAAVLRRDCRL
jgi:cytochrome c2